MEELKPCSLDAAQKWVEQEISDYCTDGMLINSEIEAVSALKRIKIELNRRAEPENKALTKADRIRSMSDEELAGFIQSNLPIFRTYGEQLDWLGQPYARKPGGAKHKWQ